MGIAPVPELAPGPVRVQRAPQTPGAPVPDQLQPGQRQEEQRPGITAGFLRVLLHALIILAAMTVLNQFVVAKNPLRIVLDAIAPFSFGLFALSCAASLHGRRALAACIALGVLLCSTPSTPEHMAHYLVSVGIGLLIGTALHSVLREAAGRA